MGRPTDYDQSMCQKVFELCQAGATDFEVAEALDIHIRNLYRWKHAHPELAQAMKLGKDAPDDRVEASMYHRAVGYNYHAVKIMQHEGAPYSVPYVEHVPPDVGAGMSWLTNRRKDQWRNRQTTQLVGEGDGPVVVKHTIADDLSDDELARIAAQGVRGSEPDAGGGSTAPPESPEGPL